MLGLNSVSFMYCKCFLCFSPTNEVFTNGILTFGQVIKINVFLLIKYHKRLAFRKMEFTSVVIFTSFHIFFSVTIYCHHCPIALLCMNSQVAL